MTEDQEGQRLEALRRLAVLDTAEEARFDALTELAAFTFKAPVALISLVDSERQWFKSRYGFEPRQTARDIAFCDHAIRSDDVMVVTDALKDERFRSNPLVTGNPGVRFYAGAPLKTPDGHRVGTLCVLDFRPRAAPTEAMRGRLKALAASVMDGMLMRLPPAEAQDRVAAGGEGPETPPGDAESKLERLEWAFNAYTRATSALLHSGTLDDVAKSVCEALVEEETYATAFVGLADQSPERAVKVVARAGRASGYVDGLNLTWSNDQPSGLGPTGRAIRSGLPEFVVDTLDNPLFGPWRERATSFGIRSSLTIPFSRGETILGVLVVYGREPNAFGAQEMAIFQQLAEELAFAMALESDRKAHANARAAAAQLAQLEEFYKMLIDQIDDLIVSYDLKQIITYASPAIRQLGYTPSEVIGRPIGDLLPKGVVVHSLALDAVERGLPMPTGRNNCRQLVRRDGSLVWVEGKPAKLFDDDGQFSGIVTVLRNVDERIAIEEALQEKTRDAEAALAAKAQFLANMSHEIRTPLTSVIGFADLLARLPDLPDVASRYVGQIVANGRSLLALVNDILDFSRLDAGGLEADLRPVNIHRLVTEITESLRPAAAAKALTLEAVVADSVPDWVETDPHRLRQILTNLVGNAVKFTPAGAVEVRVHRPDSESDAIRVTVQDTGRGIPPEQMDRIFHRFAQVDETNTREFGGAGLGLAISKGLVEMLGGTIGVESELGRGSTFWFTISAPTAAAPGPEPGAPDAGQAEDLPPLQVLVVDDVAQNRELVRSILSTFDVEVTEAADGQEAVEAADQRRFDIVLMDIQMPRLDGRAASRAIRAHSKFNRTTPILAVSADVLPQHIEACEAAGMNDHIGKPIDIETLLTKIQLWTSGP